LAYYTARRSRDTSLFFFFADLAGEFVGVACAKNPHDPKAVGVEVGCINAFART
jgi:hypothetical protein